MILGAFDGINCNFAINPRHLKILYYAMESLTASQNSPQLVKLSQVMKTAGFEYTPADVWAILRQFQLETKGMAENIRNAPATPEPAEEPEDKEPIVAPPPTKKTIN